MKIFSIEYYLKENGNELTEPYSKYLGEGMYELRAQQGNNIVRVLYFFMIGQKIVITNGFIKKSQKTPRRELVLAKKYRANYMERVLKNE